MAPVSVADPVLVRRWRPALRPQKDALKPDPSHLGFLSRVWIPIWQLHVPTGQFPHTFQPLGAKFNPRHSLKEGRPEFKGTQGHSRKYNMGPNQACLHCRWNLHSSPLCVMDGSWRMGHTGTRPPDYVLRMHCAGGAAGQIDMGHTFLPQPREGEKP